jgi:hypothetical protein
MPANPVHDKEIIDEIMTAMVENGSSEVMEWSSEHEWLVQGGATITLADGRTFLLQFSEVQR